MNKLQHFGIHFLFLCGISFWKNLGSGQGNAEICRTLKFTPPLNGHALVNHVIRSIFLERQDACRVECYLDNDCLSYNFGRLQDGHDICQLSDSDHIQHPEDLKKSEGFIYRGTENACSRNLCSTNGKCVIELEHNTYYCKCQVGYGGQYCEKDMWKKINKDPVCFRARDDNYGTFSIKESGLIYTFKLHHKSGFLSCNPNIPSSYWGCSRKQWVDGRKLLTVITHTNRTELLLAEYLRGNKLCRYYSYQLNGTNVNSTKLTFNKLPSPLSVTINQEFQIWYGQDLADCSEKNNSGQTCVDVYAWYA